MMRHWKQAMAMLLAVLLLTGCATGNQPDPTTEPTETTAVQNETSEPTEVSTEFSTAPSLGITDPNGEAVEAEQLRLSGYDAGWVGKFTARWGSFTLVNSADEVTAIVSALGEMGKNVTMPESYDEQFFQEYRLVLIPMQSGSGSVRYAAQTKFDGETVTVALTAEMPQVGTADMADWLVLVPLARDAFPEGCLIEVEANQDASGSGNIEIHDK